MLVSALPNSYSSILGLRYLVLDHNGSPLTKWWNSDANDAAYIDFTNPAAATWFYDRLVALKTLSGVDSYKFDAGESSWTPIVSTRGWGQNGRR